jgi:ATP-dependent RNA helicase RhlE
MNFAALNFAPELLQAIKACGFKKLTPIQEQSIPLARQGKDLLATAQTGTGKTAAYALPILQQMIDRPKKPIECSPRVLILAPTRELTEQVADNIKQFAQFLPLKTISIFGGVKLTGQATKLRAGVDIVVATPGRLLEHIELCNVNLSKVEFVVLDEADRMLDMGFIIDIQKLLNNATGKHQTLLFSATSSHAVTLLANTLLKRHVTVAISKQNVTADTVTHVCYPVEERRKYELFNELIRTQNWFQVLAFTSTKEQADTLIKSLKDDNISAAVCHGDKTQGARRRALQDFKDNKIQVLVATEVAARGLDIDGLDFVVNLNLPFLAEDYVHRIGRTGRAGKKGTAISFISREEERTLAAIEAMIGTRIKRIFMEGYEVGDREPLIKSLHEKPSFAKTKMRNKPTETRITSKTSDTKNDAPVSAAKQARITNKSGIKTAKVKTSPSKKIADGKTSVKLAIKKPVVKKETIKRDTIKKASTRKSPTIKTTLSKTKGTKVAERKSTNTTSRSKKR